MAQKIIEELASSRQGALATYKAMRVGDAGWLSFCLFELATLLLTNLPGALGILLRSRCYRPFFRRIGRGTVFGMGVVIRCPGRIELGDQVIIDDFAVLDAKGARPQGGIVIGDRVFISRNVILGCKDGAIRIGSNGSIGPNSTVHSVENSHVTIGDFSVIAAYCYLIGAPDYRTDRIDIPMAKQGFEEGRGIEIGRDTWLGAYACVLDGAKIGEGSMVGAKSLVRREVAPLTFAAGIPATARRRRGPEAGPA